MSTRILDNWIEAFLEYNENTESPKRFYLWGAIAIIAALLGRKCWVDQVLFQVFPNLYIILVAESAVVKKTTSANRAVELYRELFNDPQRDVFIPRVFEGHITAAKLSQDIANEYHEEGTASIFIYSSDLQELIGPDFYSSGLESLLTKLYDMSPAGEWATKTCGIDRYEKPFVPIFGCTTYKHLESIPGGFIERGFAGRTIFVVDKATGVPIAFPGDVKKQTLLKGKLISDLYNHIMRISGEFKWADDKTRKIYKQWYDETYYKAATIDPRLQSYYGRKGADLLKIAMVVHASKYDDTILLSEDINKAIEYLEDAEEHMASAFTGITMSEETKAIDKIVNYIKANGGKVLRSELHHDLYYYGSARQLKEGPLDTMHQAGMLELEGKYYKLVK